MEPFPLFKLPYLAFKHVIVRMDFIKFALCSAKCYQIVKAMNLKVRYLTVEYSQCNQGLRIEFRKYFIYYWYFKNWETRHMKDCNELSRKNESIFPKKIASDPHGNNIDAVEHLAIFVSDLFRIEQIFYKLNADAFTNFREYFSDRIVNRKVVCDRVIIGACTFYEHLDGYYHMTNAGIHFVLDNLPDDIELSFSGRFPDDFEYKKLVTQRRVSTDSCKLMISEQFLNSKFQQLTVGCGSRLTLEDYNSFMRKWSKHELEHDFQYIIMAIDYELYGEKWHEDEEHLETIFDGLNVKEYDHTRNLEDYPQDPLFCKFHKLFDIHRDDGMVASISLDDSTFKFRTWIPGKERFPY